MSAHRGRLTRQWDSLRGEVQGGLLVLGLAREAQLPGEAQHVLDGIVDAQTAGVVQRGAALVVLAAQQGLHALTLKDDMVSYQHSPSDGRSYCEGRSYGCMR